MPRSGRAGPVGARTPIVVGLAVGLVVSLAVGLAACSSDAARPVRPAPSAAAGTLGALPAGTVVAFLGDSYTQGAGASRPSRRWSTVLAAGHGWSERNFGVGGSGFTHGSAYADRVVALAAARPDVVVVAGGLNDLAAAVSAPGAEAGAIDSTFAALRQALPRAVLVALRPFFPAAPAPAQLATIAQDERAAVTAVGGVYVDIGQPLRGRFTDLAPDHLHPNDVGHRALADAVDRAFATVPTPPG